VARRRQITTIRVVESIVRLQPEFLAHGLADLTPLTLADVASDIGMDAATVSRVSNSTTVDTAWGTLPLSSFFPSGLVLPSGDGISSRAVKDKIASLVANKSGEPRSDREISELLRMNHGIAVARRTVAKYRCQLGIASTRTRRDATPSPLPLSPESALG
jgi:RNA polymerase sigma-54 factor